MSKETIIVAGAVAQKPWRGGHTWVFLQYVLGFRKLGYDVIFVDRLEGGEGADYFMRVMNEFGLNDSCALLDSSGNSVIGISRALLLQRAARAALLLNVMGFLRDEEILGAVRKRVFLDIDPGFGQMWQELGLCRMFDGHDAYVTIGENIGKSDCTIPTCGVRWITSRQPVQLDYWRPSGDSGYLRLTSIASWRGDYGPVEFRGKTYGLRVHEFRKLAGLPKSTCERFEIALDIHPADHADRRLLEKNGWTLLAPDSVSHDPFAYHDFIQSSGAEFVVAKNMYVETRSGWFSDRSICYLACGKPVLAQDTGLQSLFPIGEGLLTFKCFDEAVAGVHDIARRYREHARAARAIAIEYFDSNKVLRSLMDKVL